MFCAWPAATVTQLAYLCALLYSKYIRCVYRIMACSIWHGVFDHLHYLDVQELQVSCALLLQGASWHASATPITALWVSLVSGRSSERASPVHRGTSSTTSTSWLKRCCTVMPTSAAQSVRTCIASYEHQVVYFYSFTTVPRKCASRGSCHDRIRGVCREMAL
jgi:hypothetical protein